MALRVALRNRPLLRVLALDPMLAITGGLVLLMIGTVLKKSD